MNWEEQLGIKVSALVAGVVGAIISLTFEQKLSFYRAVLLLFTGGATAGYTAPFIIDVLKFNPSWGGFTAFLLGLFAMRLVSILMKILDMVKDNPTIILSLPKFLALLKNDYPSNSSNSGNSDSDKPSVHTTGKDDNGDQA